MNSKWKNVLLILLTVGFLIINANTVLLTKKLESIDFDLKQSDHELVAENLALELENGVLKLQIEADKRIIEENERLKTQNDMYIKLFDKLPKNVLESAKNAKTMVVTSLEETEPIAAYVSATAYTEAEDECSRPKGDPNYGITASGEPVTEWYTIASNDLPLGTKVYIPYFKDEENGGIFTVTDRMPKGYTGAIDVYMTTKNAALEFGQNDLTVYILPDE